MTRLSLKYFILILIFLFTTAMVVDGHSTGRNSLKDPGKGLFGKGRKIKSKSKKTREPKSVTKAKRTQEKKQLKLKQDYFDYVDKSKKRAYQIQSPEVKARMKQNQKDITDREKSKKKNRASATRRGSNKYKR